jgi:type IV pilus assembly protein PilZ
MANPPPKNSLSLVIKDKAALYASWMPFIKGGALFVRTNQNFRLKDEVIVQVELSEESLQVSIKGKVVWLTPRGAQGGRISGVGVQIIEDKSGGLVKKIETILAGSEKSDRVTDTF